LLRQICEYLELEETFLRAELLIHPLGLYTEAAAAAEAKGVMANRLQNVVITLDKAKMFLQCEPGQPRGPLLRLLTDDEVVEHLWTGARSVARRVLIGASQAMSSQALSAIAALEEDDAIEAGATSVRVPPPLHRAAALLRKRAATPAEARARLEALVAALREADLAAGGGLTAGADILTLYAATENWLTRKQRGLSFYCIPFLFLCIPFLFLCIPFLFHCIPGRLYPSCHPFQPTNHSNPLLPSPKKTSLQTNTTNKPTSQIIIHIK
jgi:hypothetical protein